MGKHYSIEDGVLLRDDGAGCVLNGYVLNRLVAELVRDYADQANEIKRLEDHLDLMVDEFMRIKALFSAEATSRAAEVTQLCERAITTTKQNVPLIEQRDNFKGQLYQQREYSREKAAALLALEAQHEALVNTTSNFIRFMEQVPLDQVGSPAVHYSLHLDNAEHSTLIHLLDEFIKHVEPNSDTGNDDTEAPEGVSSE